MKLRGVFEKVPGSGIWWIQYKDSNGRRRRECVGTKSAARDLVQKRRNERRERRKMPENFRAAVVSFGGIAKSALEWSKKEKLSYEHDKWRMARVVEQFGDRPADGILPRRG